MTGLSRDLVDSLFPQDLADPAELEQRYPPRELPPAAEVTRFAPSPTGWLHIGGIFTASVNLDIARHSCGDYGVYLLRIEDTDQARFEAGALEQFEYGFQYFGIKADETDDAVLRSGEGLDVAGRPGRYGPYVQSARADIYQSYVRELMRQGKAYPCFETPEQ